MPILLKRMLRRDGDAARVDEFLSWLRGAIQGLGERSPVLIVSARRFHEGVGECPGETLRWIDWHVRGTCALALMSSGETAAAMDAFRSACAALQPRHEIAMGEMLRLVPELIAAGAPEGDLIDVLGGDERRSTALQPVIVALRLRTGESVRAPVEVLEVAADLGKCIEKRLATGVMPGFMHRSG